MRAVGILVRQQRVQPVLWALGARGNDDSELTQPRRADCDEECRNRLDTTTQIGKTRVDELAPGQRTSGRGHGEII